MYEHKHIGRFADVHTSIKIHGDLFEFAERTFAYCDLSNPPPDECKGRVHRDGNKISLIGMDLDMGSAEWTVTPEGLNGDKMLLKRVSNR
eukprot:TRINITY_DN100025_c0_g1_i1.p1 TRINITY_DN100025_c0_g1~~TRINITY_DN100025_c0_g1_i1.p1  ORF type:complete len:104 (+),score=8.01 TRINITY_DN100025_c0_g1_i1:43-312(+)